MSERYIDDIFKQTLENHEVSPPFSNWDKIQSQLPQKRAFYQRKSFKAGLLSLLLFLSGVTWYVTTQSPHLPNVEKRLAKEKSTQQQTASHTMEATHKPNTTTPLPSSVNPESGMNVPITPALPQATASFNNKDQAMLQQTKEALASNLVTGISGTANKNKVATKATEPNTFYNGKTGITANQYTAKSTLSAKNNSTTNINQNTTTGLTNLNPVKETNTADVTQKSANFAPDTEPKDNPIVTNETAPATHNTETTSSQTDAVPKEGAQNNVINAVSFIGKPRKDKTNGFYFGSFYGVHVSRLLNNQALTTTRNVEEVQQRLHKGNSFGFTTGYNFNEHWGIQSEWIVKSAQGQSVEYKPKESVSFQNTEINLHYTQIPLLVKYRINRTSAITRYPAVINFLAGIQYGMLRSAEINLNNPFMHNNLLKKTQWGMAVGFDYDVYLTPNYFLSFGARGSFATSSNGFTHVQFPNQNTANHLLLGLRAGLSYRFKP
ncbi:MAG TPA: outer membrane beta-barrel protein [Chitinophagales bacterium]|nr:outer membrane beta-barrel protein [Chitinophagales bacterium]